MEYFEMKKKKSGIIVRVYNITIDNGHSYATCWIPSERRWETLAISSIAPMDCHLATDGDGCSSKTERNKYKDKLELMNATWMATDGSLWHSIKEDGHKMLDEAIRHQKELENN